MLTNLNFYASAYEVPKTTAPCYKGRLQMGFPKLANSLLLNAIIR